MEDQASRLRKLVEKRIETKPALQPMPQPVHNDVNGPDEKEFAQVMIPVNPSPPPAPSLSLSGPRVIAITSGKGGVGKTNLTVNLAIALGMAGKRVLIIDADLGMANVDVVLGTVSKMNLLHLLQPEVTLQDVLLRGPYGVNYISGGSGMEQVVDFSPEEQGRLMGKLMACGTLADIILLDTGAGLGKHVMDFILAVDEVVLITTPEPTALTDAYSVMKAYSRYSLSKNMKLIVNRAYDEAEGIDVVTKLRRTSDRFLQMELPQLGFIYEDRNVMRSVKQQKPFMIAYPSTIASKCVKAIANNLLYGGQQTVKRGWQGFLEKFF